MTCNALPSTPSDNDSRSFRLFTDTIQQSIGPRHVSLLNPDGTIIATTRPSDPADHHGSSRSRQGPSAFAPQTATITIATTPDSQCAIIPLECDGAPIGSLLLDFDPAYPPDEIQSRLASALDSLLPLAVLTHTAVTQEQALLLHDARVEQLRQETETYNRQSTALTTTLLHERQTALSERQHHLALLGQLAAAIAHDVNNGLAILLAQCHRLTMMLEPHHGTASPITDWLAQHERTLHDIAATVQRTQCAPLPGAADTVAPIALNDLVTEVISLTKPKWNDEAQRAHAPITVTTHLGPIQLCMANAAQLRHALINLFFNAVDAMPRGGTIAVTTAQQNGHIELQITDTGIGMTPETQARIFEPFFTTKGPRGTGLGLPTIRDTIRRHGGTIQLKSAPGAGTTVTLRLPVTPPHHSSHFRRHQYPPRPPRLKLLAVDDRAELTDLLSRLLQALGHDIETTTDPATALHRATAEPFDMLLTDLSMPGGSGLELAVAVKRVRPLLPIVLITGWNEPAIADHDAEDAITEILHKPYTPQQLDAVIAAAWHKHTAPRASRNGSAVSHRYGQ